MFLFSISFFFFLNLEESLFCLVFVSYLGCLFFSSCRMGETIGPRLYSCSKCGNHVGLHDDIISKSFQVKFLPDFSEFFLVFTFFLEQSSFS